MTKEQRERRRTTYEKAGELRACTLSLGTRLFFLTFSAHQYNAIQYNIYAIMQMMQYINIVCFIFVVFNYIVHCTLCCIYIV